MNLHNQLQLHLIKKLPRKKGNKGFSLLELVVVIAVLAILAAIGLPKIINLLNEAIFSATKMSLNQCHSECVTDPDSPPTGPPIPGVVFSATDCSSEMTATINGQTEEFPCVISLNMSTGEKTHWLGSYKDCVDSAREVVPPPMNPILPEPR